MNYYSMDRLITTNCNGNYIKAIYDYLKNKKLTKVSFGSFTYLYGNKYDANYFEHVINQIDNRIKNNFLTY
jgi:hypothetical protein